VCSGEANRAASGEIAPNTTPISNFSRRTSLILRTDNPLAGKLILLFEGRLPAILWSSVAICLWNHSGEAELSYWIGLKLFGFIPKSVYNLQLRNPIRDHPCGKVNTGFGTIPNSVTGFSTSCVCFCEA
jgi:hypothetical protein